MIKNNSFVTCYDASLSIILLIPPLLEGTKCDIQCPVDCRCILGNYSAVIGKCPNGDILMKQVHYPPNVTYLSWAHNDIQNISKDSFVSLAETLKVLDLKNNSLQHLRPNVFESLTELQVLDLRQNMLEEILCGVFGGLESLKGLDLRSNRLKEIRSCIFIGVEGLLWFLCGNNMFKEIQPGILNVVENLTHLVLDGNVLKEIGYGVFNGLGNLVYLNLGSNILAEIQPDVFMGLGKLSRLYLNSNMLEQLKPDFFNGLQNLSRLYLDNNMLTEILPNTFSELGNLSLLSLGNNLLKMIHFDVFERLGSLSQLFLSNNMLEQIPPGVFTGIEMLEELYMSNIMLTKLKPTVLGGLTSLLALKLSSNPLRHLHPDTFQNLTSLDYLCLHNISLAFLPKNIFQALWKLQHLDLSANYLKELRFQPFARCVILETLNLTENPLQWITTDSFFGLNVSAQVFVDNPAVCCFVTKANCRSSTSKSPFLTCGRMLPYDVLRVVVWVISIITIVNNVASVLVRCKQRKQINKVQFLLITNLTVSDLLMGVYLMILLSVDLFYADYFPSHSEAWRNSALCKVAGSLSVLSSEASVFFITLISIDRFLRVMFPFGQHWLSNRFAKKALIGLWLVAFVISITSLVLLLVTEMHTDFYAVSEICVGLPLSRHLSYNTSEQSVQLSESFEPIYDNRVIVQEYKITGNQIAMYFSIAIFTVLNLVCFLIVGFCYTSIFILIWSSAKKSGISISKSEARMAMKMFLLVLTDFCCWVPIGVLSILVQTGAVEVDPVAYAWIATFLLPINSCINPFLYTLGDVIAEKVTCPCIRHKKQKSDENIEMRPFSRPSSSKMTKELSRRIN